MKRVFDLAVALLGLAISAPAWVVIAAWIRLDSSGPVIFRQYRVGRGGVLFTIMKFRTMRVDGVGPQITSAGDARITPSGRWLRKTKLDELPQLLNVVMGDMSIVGPRPEVPKYVDLWGVTDREIILSVRPGITDPASIEFRNEDVILARAEDPEATYVDVVLPRKVALYRQYVESAGMLSDVRLIGRTLRAVGFG
jgi:lipopolysaccharide/colanic/teichoic acid biosynthesis glycosyltransferase